MDKKALTVAVLQKHRIPYSYRKKDIAIDSPLLHYELPPQVMIDFAAIPIRGISARINQNTGRPYLLIHY